MKLLFICKKRIDNYGISFGLLNSARFVGNALNMSNIESKVIMVQDNNAIDREVYTYKPTHVIIEAYWVVPSKFDILCQKYPNIQWIVRGHSKIPFFAHEGISMRWTDEYIKKMSEHKNLHLAFNSVDTVDSFSYAFHYNPLYMPNIYQPNYKVKNRPVKKDNDYINIGCFGAIRPMKNHLQQAFASIKFAEDLNKKLKFHVNSDRTEQNGENIIKNLRHLFENSPHQLVEHSWLDHHNFIKLVASMDMGLQVSLSESFNIVSADFVYNGVVFVGSTDINWLSSLYQANANDIYDIVKKMKFAWYMRRLGLHHINNLFLAIHNKNALYSWIVALDRIRE